MKKYTTSAGHEFNVEYATAIPAGYGHKAISIDLVSGKKSQSFYETTDNMPDFDNANDLESQERYEALFDLVKYKLDSEINEWLG